MDLMSDKPPEAMKPAEVDRLRDELFAHQIQHQLYAFSPYYKKTIDKTGFGRDEFQRLEDLHKLTRTARSRLARDPDEFYLRPTRKLIQKYGAFRQVIGVAADMVVRGSEHSEKTVRSEYEDVHELHTAGTQGHSIPLRLSRRDLTRVSQAGKRMLEVAGVTPSDIVLNLLDQDAGGPFLCPWLGGIEVEAVQEAPGRLDTASAVEYLRSFRATVLIARATDARAIFDRLGLPPPDLKTLILAPESGIEEEARAIKERLLRSVRVIPTYWFAEARVWWADCSPGPQQLGYHTNPLLEIVETVPSEAQGVAPGDLEICYTGIDHRGTALARYQPGDVVKGVESGQCPGCGRYGDRIMGPVNRVGRFVQVNVRGAQIPLDPARLAGSLALLQISGWQVEVSHPKGSLNGLDDVLVLFQVAPGSDPARVAVELDKAFRKTFGFRPAQFVMSDRVEGKIVDLRPPS